MQNKKITIPSWLLKVKYNGRIIPNGKPHDIAIVGANCQVFAIHLLREYNVFVPEFRSSELWEDTEYSEKIMDDFQPLDLLFFHKKKNAYGAHIAIFIGDNQVVHSAKKNGFPVIWNLDTFFEHPEYQFLLGAKRFFKL